MPRLADQRDADVLSITVAQQRRDMLQDLTQHGSGWPEQLSEQIRERLAPRDAVSSQSSALVSSMTGGKGLSLVDDDTIQREILVSRLSLALLDRCSWEFNDLRARLMKLNREPDLPDEDLFRAQVLARVIVRSWLSAGLGLETWRGLEEPMHKAFARHAEEVYHETNRWLVDHGVMPEVDLRPFIRRSDGSATEIGSLEDVASSPPAAGEGGSAAWSRAASSLP
eukprot:gene4619-6303_t